MAGKVYEIMTKATLSKGTKKTISKYDYVVNEIDKILGCWICNHQYQGIIREHQAFIEGSFDLHIFIFKKPLKTQFILLEIKSLMVYNDFVLFYLHHFLEPTIKNLIELIRFFHHSRMSALV